MLQDLVSVIMPAYNSETTIRDAIRSVLCQSYSNVELIIVDDKSTDQTKAIIQEEMLLDDRIILLSNVTNLGVVASRNKAIEIAKGKYISFLDSDDFWDLSKLQYQIDYMIKKGVYFSYTSYVVFKENPRPIRYVIKAIEKMTYKKALSNTIIGCLTVMYDASEIGKVYMPQLKHGEDHFTWLSILERGYIAYGIEKPLAFYRVKNGSLSSNKFYAVIEQWNNYRYYKNKGILKATNLTLMYVFNALVKNFIKRDKYAKLKE